MAQDSLGTDSFFSNTLATQTQGDQSQTQTQSDLDHIEPRQATLFLVDATPPMFEQDPNTGESPFMKSLMIYENNMKMLCGFNRDDWLSLILFGTNDWDKDPETKNVLTVQKFQKVSLDMLKEITAKIANHQEVFNPLSSDSTYPLHDALWHASQAFAGVKTVIIARKVVLFTCEDNPFADDANERHRIRARVLTFRNLEVDLRVMGLKVNFDHNLFYKDLEIISSGIDPKSYKKVEFDDLEEEIQFPSRTISNIPWRFSKNVEIPVSIFTVSTETKYPEKAHVKSTNNEPLTPVLVYKKDVFGDEDDIDNEGEFNSNVVAAGGIAKFQEHGDKKIVFDVTEISRMFDHFEKGIETLCFKQIECDPMYHVESPKFLCFNETAASESQKQFFSTLVDNCEAENLMAVCRITYRLHTTPNIFYCYPSANKGGFFIYKMAYEDHVRNLDDTLRSSIFRNDRQNLLDEDVVNLFEKVIKKTTIKFDPSLFKNPKLGSLIANVEALALDLDVEQRILPPDSTLPSTKIRDRLAVLMPEYHRIFGEDEEEEETPVKRVKLIDDQEMRSRVRIRKVETCTVAQLKEFLKQHRVSAAGSRKADLVAKVYEFFENT